MVCSSILADDSRKNRPCIVVWNTESVLLFQKHKLAKGNLHRDRVSFCIAMPVEGIYMSDSRVRALLEFTIVVL